MAILKPLAFIGMDPGQEGTAYALSSESEIITSIRFEKSTIVDICNWYLDLAKGFSCTTALEDVHSMPRDGSASAFKFGRGFGRLEGILAATKARHTYVTPQTWQKALRCLTGGDKKIAKAAAERLWPDFSFTQKTADGCLIAEYCRQRAMGLLINQSAKKPAKRRK